MKSFIEFFFKKYKLCFSILFIFILLMISYLVYINNDNSVKASNSSFNEVSDIVKKTTDEIKEKEEKIKVDVKGLVVNPGVYELNKGSRVIDAIEIAGWVLDNADLSSLNLSKILSDENVIVVTTKEEKEPEYITKYIYQECNCDERNDACLKENDIVNYTNDNKQIQNDESNINQSSNLISINTASKDELQTLSGVGESKALAIIKYREEHGPFTSIDEIKNVSGIGDALFEKIKENITI